jgi:hypothetical protein
VWLVDPAIPTLEVLALDGAAYRLTESFGGTDTVHAPPFETVALPPSVLWEP